VLILAVDTSAVASAAVLTGDRPAGADPLLAGFATEDTRSHAEVLAPQLAALLDEAGVTSDELDAVVVGVGPGPFTGLRSGIATARTLSFVWKLPLYGAMSLHALAWTVAGQTEGEFAVATDARRKEVYWARYRSEGGIPVLLDGPQVGPAATLPPLPVYGAGAGLYAEQLQAVDGFDNLQPTAAALGRYALHRLGSGESLPDSTPLYLRESDAQVPGPRKRALEPARGQAAVQQGERPGEQ
jgi:tRNA threonylcarbamoyladenosine biosynthesis protein TsaB